MKTDIGEYIVGAYLKLIYKCDVVDYNVKPPVDGLRALEELDVIGLDFNNNIAYLCEVTTHLGGTLYKNNAYTVTKINQKHTRQKKYAKKYLKQFKKHVFMFWSPICPVGYITENLEKIKDFQLIINFEYTKRIEELRKLAKETEKDTNNPFFRILQILERLRK